MIGIEIYFICHIQSLFYTEPIYKIVTLKIRPVGYATRWLVTIKRSVALSIGETSFGATGTICTILVFENLSDFAVDGRRDPFADFTGAILNFAVLLLVSRIRILSGLNGNICSMGWMG
ncbi:hypothetical protein TWF694_000434 [Orbilia ellipsospora]|uniref:Uncharacterized protein n=1 Tax=Orbilia ellipsospora TaxID=2528407 RepID=A0AAV9XNJ9_9PEZI